MQSEKYLLACSRYIELNPVRASMVETPGAYKWSSYTQHAWGSNEFCITDHHIYQQLGLSSEDRRQAYRELFRHHLNNDELHEIRTALNRDAILGSSYFKDKVKSVLNRRIQPGKPGRPRIEEEEVLYELY